MADSDQILQLGIEEARNGNRDEARNLFELLTRQEPNNAQAWLWLAGVADNPDQRRAALQRVLELDPGNDMARKGLQAMGVATTVTPAEPVAEPVRSVDEPVVVPAEPDRPRSADEDFADQLDTAFDDYDALPRAQAPVRREETLDEDAVGGRVTTERPSVRSSRLEFDDEDDEPVRRGPHPLLWVLVALIGAVLLGFILLSVLGGGGGGTVGRPTSEATTEAVTAAPGEATAVPGGGEQPTVEGATQAPGEATAVPGGGEQPTVEGATPAPGEATAVPGGGEQPATTPTTPEQPTATGPSVPPEQANPAAVAPGTVLQANNWSYNFPNANYAVYLGNQAGGQTAQGEFVHVLVFVANNTGTAQPVPADFFVLKDSQGRVFSARPDVSSALVQRGVNADLGMQDNVPANGTTTSVYLVFDVAGDANGLVLFARPNPDQGWQLTPIR